MSKAFFLKTHHCCLSGVSTKNMQKVKIEMQAKSTLKEPSITYSGHKIKLNVVASLRNEEHDAIRISR